MTDFIVSLATLGYIGEWAALPGFIAVILGVVWIWLVYLLLGRWTWMVILGQIILAIGISTYAEAYYSIKDPGMIVIDEFVAVGVILWGIKPPTSYFSGFILVFSFLLFSLLDSLKPFGISYVELLPSGLGIVADDVVAALIVKVFLVIFKDLKFTSSNS